jgi:Txe/YoeB family toxin of Txe-Axe toxin-antitoxin module
MKFINTAEIPNKDNFYIAFYSRMEELRKEGKSLTDNEALEIISQYLDKPIDEVSKMVSGSAVSATSTATSRSLFSVDIRKGALGELDLPSVRKNFEDFIRNFETKGNAYMLDLLKTKGVKKPYYNHNNIYEYRLNDNHRVIFRKDNSGVTILGVGTHNITDRIRRNL